MDRRGPASMPTRLHRVAIERWQRGSGREAVRA